MKNYQALSMEIVVLEQQDIVTTSGGFKGEDHEFSGPGSAGESGTLFNED